jgi:hypothetical protein
MDIAIYSHSDFFDILEIQLHCFKKLFADNSINIYLFSDKHCDFCPYNTLLYNDSLPYASRILSCINQINNNNNYILVLHENDGLIKFDKEFINILLQKMKENNINSLELKQLVEPIIEQIFVNDSISLSRKIVGYVFSVQPTIWLKSSLVNLLNTFPTATYRTIECPNIHNYIRDNYKAYILNDTQSIQTIWYRVCKHFIFIHLTSRELLLPCSKNNGLEESIQEEHEKINNQFLSKNKVRGFQPHIYAFQTHMQKDH